MEDDEKDGDYIFEDTYHDPEMGMELNNLLEKRHKKLVKHMPVKYIHTYSLSWVNIGAVFEILYALFSKSSYRFC